MGLTEVLLVVGLLGGIIAVLYPTLRGAAAEARVETAPVEGGGGEGGGGPDEGARARRELDERRRAVLDSLEEIDGDLAAGNLTEEDHRRQRRRYESEAAAVLVELEKLGRARAGESGRAERSPQARSGPPAWLAWVGAGAGFAALAWLALSGALAPRGEGGVMTGGLPGAAGETSQSSPPSGALVPVDESRLASLEEAVAADSSDLDALVELGELYLALQRYGDVAHLSLRALAIDSLNPSALTNLGMTLVAAGHPDEGLVAFGKALERDADYHRALLFKGILSFQNRDFETAIASWERYLEVAPPEADTRRVQAMLEGARMAAGVE